jgi:hypothetical protein
MFHLQIHELASRRSADTPDNPLGVIIMGMEWVERFFVGGLIVSAFAVIGDVLRPKGFAGLFGAASSVALGTLTLTLLTEGKSYAALEARSMIAGALAFLAYALACAYLMGRKHIRAAPTAIAMLLVWGVCAFGLWSTLLR